MLDIKLYKSQWQGIRLILLASIFVIPSLYDIITHNIQIPTGLSWFCLCFFGLGIPIGLFNLFDRRAQIIINENGIFWRPLPVSLIDWVSIKDVYYKDFKPSSR